MKQLKTWLMPSILMVLMFAASPGAMAGVVAIVNKANASADKATIGQLYRLETQSWSGNINATLFDQFDHKKRNEFYQGYTGKDVGDIRAIWGKAVFSGRAVPPKILESDSEVKKEVARDVNAVGYVDESSVDGSVRAVR